MKGAWLTEEGQKTTLAFLVLSLGFLLLLLQFVLVILLCFTLRGSQVLVVLLMVLTVKRLAMIKTSRQSLENTHSTS